MDTKTRTFVKTFSYRTAVALSVFLAALAMGHSSGFGLTFVVLSYTVGFLTFVIQERFWNLFKWQKVGTKDTHVRSAAKTITWRLMSLFVLFAMGMIFGLSASSATEWTIVTNILFVVVHYGHERLWNLVEWGRIAKTEESNPDMSEAEAA